jgi:hypothetical protein
MTLTNKLTDVHWGDIIFLKSSRVRDNRVGFIMAYSDKTITIANTNPMEKDGEVRKIGFWSGATGYRGENKTTLPLAWFDDYEILKKYEKPKE